MADVTKKCKDCGAEFVITEENKKWYEDKGFQLPERCADCRAKRKAARQRGGK
jgi:hypothetical protein